MQDQSLEAHEDAHICRQAQLGAGHIQRSGISVPTLRQTIKGNPTAVNWWTGGMWCHETLHRCVSNEDGEGYAGWRLPQLSS